MGCVYEIVGHNAECLYVGQTGNHSEVRLHEHRRTQPWADEISHVRVIADNLDDRSERLLLEADMARVLEPKYGGRKPKPHMNATVWWFFHDLCTLSGSK